MSDSRLIDAQWFFVLRSGGNKTLIENESENIVYLWPNNLRKQPPLKLRRICFSSCGGLPVVLMTNILDERVLSDADAHQAISIRPA